MMMTKTDPGCWDMMTERKLRRCISRTATFYEGIGFKYNFCGGSLNETFDLSLDSVYPGDPGIYASIFVNRIPLKKYQNILDYQTSKRKEICLWLFNGNVKNDSGKCTIYRIQGSKIVDFLPDMPIEKYLSSPSKRRATSSKA